MKIGEILEAESFYLSEGIAFFKNSERLMKLATKMKKKLPVIEDSKEREEVANYIDNLKLAADDFVDVENSYSSGNKTEAKAAYNKLRVKYFELVKAINTESLKKFIIGAGMFTIFAILAKVLPAGRGGESALASAENQIRQNALRLNAGNLAPAVRDGLMRTNAELLRSISRNAYSTQTAGDALSSANSSIAAARGTDK